MINLKRIYDAPDQADGQRILVDRLWPRGVSKERAAIDLWLKEVAPSAELRTWFDHKPERFKEFSAKYVDELSRNPAFAELKELIAKHPNTTLLYAAKDPWINHAVVLRQAVQD